MSVRSSSTVSNSVACLGADEVLVDLGDDGTGSDLVDVVVCGETFDLFTLVSSRDVDRGVIALPRAALDGLELTELATDLIDTFFDLFFGWLRAGDFDPQGVVARNVDLGADLDGGIEDERTLFHATGDVVVGRRDEVDVVFDDRLEEEVGHGVFDGLPAGNLFAEMGLEHLPRYLARPKARQPDLPRQFLECRVDRGLELVLIDLDRQLHFVVFKLGHCALHCAAV